MTVRLHDTRTDALVDVAAGHTVRVYVCGITPYDSTHLGHAFTYVSFDALTRYLRHEGHRVLSTRNVTDVDDDILRTASQRGVRPDDLARQEVARFDDDLAALGVLAPDATPWATETVPQMATAVARLLDVGAAYATDDGRVYFDTGAAGSRFGELSRLDRDEMLVQFAEKGGDPDAPGKRDALDFLLWQPSADGEPRWDGPVGPGRPGWHIECSVMAMETLGSTIDVHGGGSDLVFPHHTAEILQSEALTGQGPFARVWAHVGMVSHDGVKMSKSLGNLVFVSDLRTQASAGAVRRMLLGHHYRSGWSYSDDDLDAAERALDGWRAADGGGVDAAAEAAFHDRMRDDLDTPGALAVVDEAAASGAGATVRRLSRILGLVDLAPRPRVSSGSARPD